MNLKGMLVFMTILSSLGVSFPLFVMILVIILEVFIVKRWKNVLMQLILPAILLVTSVYCLFFYRQEFPTMAPGMYGTFFLICFFLSLFALGITKMAVNKRSG